LCPPELVRDFRRPVLGHDDWKNPVVPNTLKNIKKARERVSWPVGADSGSMLVAMYMSTNQKINIQKIVLKL